MVSCNILVTGLVSSLFASTTLAFGTPSKWIASSQNCGFIGVQSRPTFSSSALGVTRLDDMYFQVEEMEDKDSCTTEVLLNKDNTVTLFQTNGPLFVAATGKWRLKPDLIFQMTLTRTYETGQKSKERTDMGIFQFTTERSFVGELSKIGAKQGVEGSMYDGDWYSIDRKVGFFEMIDTTVGSDGEVSLRDGVRVSS